MRKLGFVVLVLCVGVFSARWAKSTTMFMSPQIVASLALTDQTDPIPSTDFFTSDTGGLYRVNAYVVLFGDNIDCANWSGQIRWIDDTARPQLLTVTSGYRPFCGPPTSNQLIVRVAPGTALSYRTVGGTGHGTPKYSLYITVEQLM